MFYMNVVNIYDDREWRVNYYGKEFGYWEGSLLPEYWTRDGRYLYVGVYKQVDGGGFEFISSAWLLRLNLMTGEVTEIFPDGSHIYAFSSESNRIAYVFEKNINILDINTWEIMPYELKMDYCRIGDLMWSPDESEIIFQTINCKDDDFFEFVSFNLVVLDLVDNAWRQILYSTELLPQSLQWIDNPIYHRWDYSDRAQDKCWMADLEIGELQPITCP